MEEQTKDLQDYISALKSRKTSILAIFITVFVISVAIAALLPPVYRSTATILIEQQEIPPELVMTTVTSYASERIQTIQAQVMSRTNLLKIIDKFNLYDDERKFATSEEIVGRMRKDARLDVISADVVDPRTGRPSVATIAFSLSYEGEKPAQVQRVASELTTLYLNENLKSRATKAEETSSFFKDETERLGNLISSLEKKLAEFKQKNADMLPELQTLNIQMLEKVEKDIEALDAQLQNLEERKFYLEGQLAIIQKDSPSNQGAAAQLALRESEYASAKSRYSDEHPDVQRLKREIELLKSENGMTSDMAAIEKQLSEEKLNYTVLMKKYTADHPDVKRSADRVASLESELKAASENDTVVSGGSPSNPAYITLKAQLEGIASDIRSSRALKKKYKEKYLQIENRILKSPQIEREYLALQRDYKNASEQYQETKAKQMHADVAKQLETESKGERFTLIDPPALPEAPVSPNRKAIIFLGFVLSLGGGVGFAVLADAISGTIHGAKGVLMTLGMIPLSVIPYQLNNHDINRKKRIRKMAVVGVLVSIIIGLLVIHFAVSPLDVLWFRILRKGEMLTS